jgi:hypothetical protein
MSDLLAESDQHCHPQADDGHKYASLCAKAVDVADLLDPWHDAVEEAKGDDVLGAYTKSA